MLRSLTTAFGAIIGAAVLYRIAPTYWLEEIVLASAAVGVLASLAQSALRQRKSDRCLP